MFGEGRLPLSPRHDWALAIEAVHAIGEVRHKSGAAKLAIDINVDVTFLLLCQRLQNGCVFHLRQSYRVQLAVEEAIARFQQRLRP
jgi:hypothetical protein